MFFDLLNIYKNNFNKFSRYILYHALISLGYLINITAT